ncbi:hypothetical protein GCM10011494_01220 [Novosphingobium endophyticum]|uniref:HTH crp-type domain-containing protein n=1 Tax=Novosphingobium endophyticum TaxID=1955250 RepID=A0A916TPD0_9SPHN|nr:Crp/Fnr family transcriptional regulator [Novosphingobium endophyticum]GGB86675.1 hypothetical protein GCM10011494_01220 [Novosphingobium endophyticum]
MSEGSASEVNDVGNHPAQPSRPGITAIDLSPVIANLRLHAPLSAADRSAIETFLGESALRVRAGSELIPAGEPGMGFALVDGWVAHEMLLDDGRMQLTALFVPGDTFDLNADLIDECEYSLRAITDSIVAKISTLQLRRLTDRHPHLRDAFAWERLQQLSNNRELLLSLGRRSGAERIAHLFCEVFCRLQHVRRTRGNECDLPLTHGQLADLTGMTSVHVHRSLTLLRSQGLIEWRHGRLKIRDFERLSAFARFDPTYLHAGTNPSGAS